MGLLGVPFCDNVPQDYRCLCRAPSHRDLGCKECGRAAINLEVQRPVDAPAPVTPATARRMSPVAHQFNVHCIIAWYVSASLGLQIDDQRDGSLACSLPREGSGSWR